MHVTQKTDTRHHKSSSSAVQVSVSPARAVGWGNGLGRNGLVAPTKSDVVEEFGGLFAATKWVQQVAVYSIFFLLCADLRLRVVEALAWTC